MLKTGFILTIRIVLEDWEGARNEEEEKKMYQYDMPIELKKNSG